ncbi:alpha/beta hydrolase [Rhodoplanes elegans]|uniref:Palmitoyl-protein thioesterase ABHD10, mitochondrial n=1 Tax=Rhodoplanes elegans TaxID=29408 RepID=A0A327KX25_9BRAD|nr:alpha/beta hydrolase [Rhodoplanes elegans]MBK5956933.1 alpha/beta hydrolase [Rhodoplanes elegans]RAI39918.1 alpha/beta hydrolase [Rhodoplanes elegans]
MDNDVAWVGLGEGAQARRIAVRSRAGASPGLVWLGGFMSDMKGTKAQALDGFAAARGQAIVRFDYSGHGESSGAFADGTIGSWLADALAVFDACCRGPQILVGSSMGGWMALLLVQALRRRASPGPASVAGLVLIAPAVDFTEELMWKRFPPAVKQAIETTGRFEQPTEYDTGPYVITRALIEDGRDHLLLGGLIETGCPVRILQGVQDPDVPWQHANALVARLAQDDVVLTLIKDGDHRLSRPEDLSRILGAVEEMTDTVAAAP